MKTVFVIYGSPTKSMLDDAVINAAIKGLRATTNFELFENIYALPKYGENDGPETVALFTQKLASADCILIVAMDYAYNLPDAVSNAFKWAAQDVHVSAMPIGLITADSGRFEVQRSMVTMLNTLGVHAREERTLILELQNQITLEKKEIVNLKILEDIRELVTETINDIDIEKTGTSKLKIN